MLRMWQLNIEASCQFQRFNQRDKTMSWSGMKLRREDGDWDLYYEKWLEYQASEKNPKYASNPAKFRYLMREIKQRIDLGWSWAVQMVVGTWRSDGWNVEIVSQYFKHSFLPSSDIDQQCHHDNYSRFIGWSPKQLDGNLYLKDFQLNGLLDWS